MGTTRSLQIVLNNPKNPYVNQATQRDPYQIFLPKKTPDQNFKPQKNPLIISIS